MGLGRQDTGRPGTWVESWNHPVVTDWERKELMKEVGLGKECGRRLWRWDRVEWDRGPGQGFLVYGDKIGCLSWGYRKTQKHRGNLSPALAPHLRGGNKSETAKFSLLLCFLGRGLLTYQITQKLLKVKCRRVLSQQMKIRLRNKQHHHFLTGPKNITSFSGFLSL